jgi:hypothetical protein
MFNRDEDDKKLYYKLNYSEDNDCEEVSTKELKW